jgi:sulfonate transport system substrate-binding protein
MAASLALGRVFPAKAADTVTVRIGWLRAPNDITLSRARGTLEQALSAHGDRIEWAGPFPAAAPALEAMNAGSIDITAGSSTACITALAANVPMVIYAYQKMSPASEGILVNKNSPLHTIADLAGHTVACNRGGTGEYLLMRALDRAGVDPSRVQRVYLSPSDSGFAFTQGYVDGWSTWDPFISIALKSYGARILADGAAIGSDNAVTLMSSRDFAKSHRDLLQLIFATTQQDNAWSLTHKDEAGRIWSQAMSIPVDLGPAIGSANAVPTTPLTQADITQIDRIADWYVTSKIVPRRPDIASGCVTLNG